MVVLWLLVVVVGEGRGGLSFFFIFRFKSYISFFGSAKVVEVLVNGDNGTGNFQELGNA